VQEHSETGCEDCTEPPRGDSDVLCRVMTFHKKVILCVTTLQNTMWWQNASQHASILFSNTDLTCFHESSFSSSGWIPGRFQHITSYHGPGSTRKHTSFTLPQEQSCLLTPSSVILSTWILVLSPPDFLLNSSFSHWGAEFHFSGWRQLSTIIAVSPSLFPSEWYTLLHWDSQVGFAHQVLDP
jgi:hypothetical protein